VVRGSTATRWHRPGRFSSNFFLELGSAPRRLLGGDRRMPQPVSSPQLWVVILAFAVVARQLLTKGAAMPERRFVALCALEGFLAFLAVGTAFRTMFAAMLLGLP